MAAVRPLAVIGHLSRDLVDGGEPRIGGAPWYATRALRALGRRAWIVAKCGEADRRRYARQLAERGLPTTVVGAGETTSFSISYPADGVREMRVEAIGEPWRPRELSGLHDAAWVHVAPLLPSDFPEPTFAALARGRRILLDGQGLVRVPELGPLRFDADFDPAILRHVTILKKVEKARSRFEKRTRKLQAPEAEIADLTRRTYEPSAQRLGQAAAGDANLRPARLIYNPKSSGGGKQLEEIIGRLRTHGIRAEIGLKTSGKAVRELVKEAVEPGEDLIIVAAGDHLTIRAKDSAVHPIRVSC